MTTRNTIAAAAALSLIVFPALAQTSSGIESNGHHYSGGPKTGIPHHMGKKETVGVSTKGKSGGPHYSGRSKTKPRHIDGKWQ